MVSSGSHAAHAEILRIIQVKVNIDSCGTVTWNVTGLLTDASAGTFSLSATDPSPSCRGIPIGAAAETVTLSSTDCASGNGNHTSPTGVFATHWQDAAPVSPRIPTSLAMKTIAHKVFNGGTAVDCDGASITPTGWGHVVCLEFTILDQEKKPILNATTLYADENLTVVRSTYTTRVQTASNIHISKDGKFRDEQRLVREAPFPAGTKAVQKQVITIRNTANGGQYTVRVNCIVKSATGITTNDVTAKADQSCSEF
jgi:hypothetical protein